MKIEREIEIVNKLGLHARAAAKLVSTAAAFASDIHLEYAGREVNAKSIMGLMMLAAARGARLNLVVQGADADTAASAIDRLFAERFGEDE